MSALATKISLEEINVAQLNELIRNRIVVNTTVCLTTGTCRLNAEILISSPSQRYG